MRFVLGLILFWACIVTLLASHAFACASVDGLPDSQCTPGSIDLRVTQANIAETICHAGYSKTVRPPVSVTTPIKIERMEAYGIDAPMNTVELDHLISLEIGGNPSDINNLWPEPWHGEYNAHMKDRLENELHRLVCADKLSLQEAQTEIRTDWVAAYRKYFCTGDDCAP